MSDIRFVMIGVVLVFVGFIVLGIFGSKFFDITVEAREFNDCFEYFEDQPPVQISCEQGLLTKVLFFGVVVGFIAGGIIMLIKGARGDWDQKIDPKDNVGPSHTDL